MPEATIELKSVKTVYICDNCGNGEMVAIMGDRLKTHSGKISHFCSGCGYAQGFDVVYPRIKCLPK